MLEEVFRDEWGRVLASLVGFLGDFDKAEEAAQEAFAIAAERWPISGVPANPGAWLVTTARNRAIDRVRRERTLAEKIYLLPAPDVTESEPGLAYRLLTLESLVRMKRTAFRTIDRVHLADMLEVGLIDASWPVRLPPALAVLIAHPKPGKD